MSDHLDRVQPPLLPGAPHPGAPRSDPEDFLEPGELDKLRNVGMPVADLPPADLKPRPRRRIAGRIALIVLLVVIGAGAASAWRFYGPQIREFAQAQIAAKEMPPQAEPQSSDAVLRELQALKQEMAQVAASQAQFDQRIAALETHPHIAPNGMPAGGSGWLDDPNTLAFVTSALQRPVSPPPRPATTTIGAGAPGPRARAQATSRAPAPRPPASAPTQAAPPLPTAPAPRTGLVPPEPIPEL